MGLERPILKGKGEEKEKKDDIYSMVTEGMEEYDQKKKQHEEDESALVTEGMDETPSKVETKETKLPGQDHPEEWQEALGKYDPLWRGPEVVPTEPKEDTIDYTEVAKHDPLWKGPEIVPSTAADKKEVVDWSEVAKHDPSWKGPEIVPPTPTENKEEQIVDWTEVVDHDPTWKGPSHAPLERPAAPAPEEQAQLLAELGTLRERLVMSERGGEKGGTYEGVEKSHWALLEEYDKKRAEFISGDVDRFVLEQSELTKKRGEFGPGGFEKFTERTDKFFRKHWLLKMGISGALLGLAGMVPPISGLALSFRSMFMGGAAMAGSYERMRRISLHGGAFGLFKGIKNEALNGFENLTPKQLESRMSWLAGYARVQGYWSDIEEPYKQLLSAYAEKLKTGNGAVQDIDKYASEQILESQGKFERSKSTEKNRMWGRRLGAIAVGAVAGGALSKLWDWWHEPSAGPVGTASRLDAYDRQPYVPKPAPGTGGGHIPVPGGAPTPPPGFEYPYGVNADEIPTPHVETSPTASEYPYGTPEDAPVPHVEATPTDSNFEYPYGSTPDEIPAMPESVSPETFEKVLDYIPAEHGLRPEYYDLIKDRTAEDFLGRKMFSTSLETQYPFPKVDGEYPWIQQKGISHIRMMDYKHLQENMSKALETLRPDPEKFETAKKLPVSEFLKQIMGQQVEKAARVIQ